MVVSRPRDRVTRFRYHSVKTVVRVRGVIHCTNGTIGFHQGVLTLYYVSVARFVLGLLVARVGVSNSVFEVIFGVRLKTISVKISHRNL